MQSTYAKRKTKILYAALLSFLGAFLSLNSYAIDKWHYDLSPKEAVTVFTKEEGKFVSYYLTVAEIPRLLLLKIYKTQKIDKKKIHGFIQIKDENTARRRVLFRLSINSAASGTGRGECGAGIEEYLFIVGINESVNVLSTLHRLTLESCLSNLVLSNEADSVQLVYGPEQNESSVYIKYGTHPGWELPITA
ncbi:MAG: hypothetical protein IV085_07945, partial [Thiobacillus sp.]|nr:hypothetical protein [Thiobacillus sp.]